MTTPPTDTGVDDRVTRRPTFGQVVRAREFRSLWLADIQSLLGDQLARVAMAILVYDRTHSSVATAAVYALTFLPAFVGNLVLGHVVDRFPRRTVLVGADVIRAGLLAVMALHHLPTAGLMVLISVAVFVGAPWTAAETALITEILTERDYAVGLGLRAATAQATQLVGFAAGGVVVAVLGARTSLGVDAASFAVSAVVIRLGVRARPGAPLGTTFSRRWSTGAGELLGDRRLRLLLGFSALLGLLVVPEGLAAPYARALHGGATEVGLLLASGPTGVLVGSVVFSRWVADPARARLLGPLAVTAGLPLLGCLLTRDLAATMVLWALSGVATAYQIQAVTEYVQLVAPARRGTALGLASANLLAAQGVGLLAGGVLAQRCGAVTAVGAAGLAAFLVALPLAALRHHSFDPARPMQNERSVCPTADGV